MLRAVLGELAHCLMVELYAKNTPNTQITFLSFIVIHINIGKLSYISFLVKVKLSSPLRALHCVYPYITQITQLYEYSLLPMTMQQNTCRKLTNLC